MKYTLEVSWTSRSTGRVTVDIPEGATVSDISRLRGEAEARAKPKRTDKPEFDGSEWIERRPIGLPDPMPPVLDAAWVTIDGTRWATDGSCMVREGGPVPSSAGLLGYGEWRTDVTAAQLAPFTRAPAEPTPMHPGIFDPRFAPMLAAGTPTGRAVDSVCLVIRDGAVVAVVMPLSGAVPGSIRADGGPS